MKVLLYKGIKKNLFNKVAYVQENYRKQGIKSYGYLEKACFRQREVKCKGSQV